MDPREFHLLSKDLINDSRPAYVRSAISRAYYAIYNVGADILTKMGFTIPESPSGHSDVQFKLHNSGDPQVKRVGSQLGDLRTKRIQADYRLSKTKIEDQKTAQAIIKQVEKMINTLDTCCLGNQRSNIIASIKQYEEKIGG